MAGIVQSIDVDVNFDGGQLSFPDEISVTDAEITRIYGGGGSEAKLKVIFEEAIDNDFIDGVRSSVRSATVEPRFDQVDYSGKEIENPAESLTFSDFGSFIRDAEGNEQKLSTVLNNTDLGDYLSDVNTEEVVGGEDDDKAINFSPQKVVGATADVAADLAITASLKKFSEMSFSEVEESVQEQYLYSEAGFSEQGAFDNEGNDAAGLEQKARVRNLITLEQLFTVQKAVIAFIEKRKEDLGYNERQRRLNNGESLQSIIGGTERDQTTSGEEDSGPDGLIDQDKLFQGDPITVEVDVIVSECEANQITETRERIFTGTVIKVTEGNNRVLTFEAMDARYQLNNFIVTLNTGEEGVPRGEIVEGILGGNSVISNNDSALNTEALGSGVEGVAPAVDEDLPDDPAEDLTFDDLLSEGEYGIAFEDINEGPSKPVTEEIIGNVKGTDRLLTFVDYNDSQIQNVLGRNDTSILGEDKYEHDADMISAVQNSAEAFIEQVRDQEEYDPQNVADKRQQRKEYRNEAVAEYQVIPPEDAGVNRNTAWGVSNYESAYKVIQEIGSECDAELHIDESNTIYWADVSEFKDNTWTSDSLPPIIEWKSGDNENEGLTLVESKYASSAAGVFAPMATETLGTEQDDKPSAGMVNLNVDSRAVAEKSSARKFVDTEIMKDSGRVRVAGNPDIRPYDTVEVDDSMIDGFAGVSQGTYDVKEVKHILNPDDGYLTEVSLGQNIEELYNKFAERQSGVAFQEAAKDWEEQTGDEATGGSGGSGSPSEDQKGLFEEMGEEVGLGDVGEEVDETIGAAIDLVF